MKGWNNHMKEQLKGFIKGVALTLSVVAGITSVSAAIKTQNAILNYNNIKISIDGKQIEPKDASGNLVEPFIIDGTTYLPVRAVASAMGKSVQWDGETNTVNLTEPSKVIADFHDYDRYDPDRYVTLSDLNYGQEVVFEAQGDITDFKIFYLENDAMDSFSVYDGFYYKEGVNKVLYEKDVLSSGEYIITKLANTSDLYPSFGMVYTNDSGETKAYTLFTDDLRGEGVHSFNSYEIRILK